MGFGGWLDVVGPQDFCVIPWHFENGASINIDDVLPEYGGLLHVLSLAVHLNFIRTNRVDYSGPFLFSGLFHGTIGVFGAWGLGLDNRVR